MSKKKHTHRLATPGKADEFHVNPFADLELNLPESPQEGFPGEPEEIHKAPTPEKHAELGPEDQHLLQAFQHDAGRGAPVKRLMVRLSVERKGRGGKTVTILHGLEKLDVLEQMEICRELRTHLGTGGRFREGKLELQGDQRQRAGNWLDAQGYRVRGVE